MERARLRTVNHFNIGHTMKLPSHYLLVLMTSLFSLGAPAVHAADLIVSGIITDEQHRPVAGATVAIPQLDLNTMTDTEGTYRLRIPERDLNNKVESLLAEKTGYRSEAHRVILSPGRLIINFRLKKDIMQADIQMHARTDRPVSTPKPFSADRIGGDEVDAVPAVSAVGALQGKMPGVTVIRGSGLPGSDLSVRIRGLNNIEIGNEPLILVDGVILYDSQVDVDGMDVESIEVLKGASSTALYGSRGANGVIRIMTKHGNLSPGLTRIRIRNEIGLNQFPGRDFRSRYHPYEMSAGHFADGYGDPVEYTQARLDGVNELTTFQDKLYPGETYDHFGQFFDTGLFLSNRIEFARNRSDMQFFAAFGRTQQPGVVNGLRGYKRNNVRINLNQRLREDLSLGANLYAMSSWRDDPIWGGLNPFYTLMFMAPIADLTAPNEDGTPYNICPDGKSIEENPLYYTHNLDLDFNRKRFMGGLNLAWKPLDWFDLEGRIGYDRLNRFDEVYLFKGFKTVDASNIPTGYYERDHVIKDAVNAALTARIVKNLGSLTTVTEIGTDYEDDTHQSTRVSGENLAANIRDIDMAQNRITTHSHREDIRAVGYTLHTRLDFKNRYIVDFGIRREGCSLFAPKEHWQTYFRSGLAWRLSRESWWPVKPADEFQLHYAFGTAGVRPPFGATGETWDYDEWPEKISLGNEKLKPALAAEHEVGLNGSFLDRLSLNIVYAHTVTKDQILSVPLPAHYVFQNQWQNAGTVESDVFEAELNAFLIKNKNLTWTAGLVYDRYTHTVTRLDRVTFGHDPYNNAMTIREGESLGAIYGYRWITDESALPDEYDYRYFDKNDDGYIVPLGYGYTWKDGIAEDLWGTDADIDDDGWGDLYWGIPILQLRGEGYTYETVKIGDITPDYCLGLQTSFRWKGLSFYALLHAQIGGDVYNAAKQQMYRDYRHEDCDQYGKSDAEKKPLWYYRTLYDVSRPNSAFVEDGTHLKLREVSLRYTFWDRTIKNAAGGFLGRIFKRFTVGIIGRNLLIYARYSGFDPEAGTNDATFIRVDHFGYPQYRTLTGLVEVEL